MDTSTGVIPMVRLKDRSKICLNEPSSPRISMSSDLVTGITPSADNQPGLNNQLASAVGSNRWSDCGRGNRFLAG